MNTTKISIQVNMSILQFSFVSSGEKMTIATDIACVVSLGCGDFPPKSIGNCDIEDLDVTNIFHAKERIKNVIQTLLACVSLVLLFQFSVPLI